MRADRLLKLAELLEADAANPEGVMFTLKDWATPSSALRGISSSKVFESEVIPLNCNTAACALGLAALSGEFASEGLTFKLTEAGTFKGTLVPIFEDYKGFDAGSVFFEIGKKETYLIFDPDYYQVTSGSEAELEVAKRIRQLVTDGKLD
jgi:hypothetical protein